MENNYLTLLMALFFLGNTCSFTISENLSCYWENEERSSKTEKLRTLTPQKKGKQVSKKGNRDINQNSNEEWY